MGLVTQGPWQVWPCGMFTGAPNPQVRTYQRTKLASSAPIEASFNGMGKFFPEWHRLSSKDLPIPSWRQQSCSEWATFYQAIMAHPRARRWMKPPTGHHCVVSTPNAVLVVVLRWVLPPSSALRWVLPPSSALRWVLPPILCLVVGFVAGR